MRFRGFFCLLKIKRSEKPEIIIYCATHNFSIGIRNFYRYLNRLKEVNEELKSKDILLSKLENELRHTQAVISEQQSSIEKSTSECLRLEKDWESYKLRVKGMLFAKDEELKKLRDGTNLTEDTKALMEEIESFK